MNSLFPFPPSIHRLRVVRAVLACTGVVVSLAISIPRAATAQAPDSVAADARIAAVTASLTRFVEHERAQKGIPAISVALVSGNRVLWARGFGWADSLAGTAATANTVYRVGSVSKLFTDIAILRLVEQGRLNLDTPIQQYLPDFHPVNPFGGSITIRSLTAHRSGLTRESPVGHYFDDTGVTLAQTVASLNSTTLLRKPLTYAAYSNAGIAVLGYVLERQEKQSFYPYLKQALLEPMGLTQSAFEPLPAIKARLARAYMWTVDGRRTEAPTFQLGIGPAGSMYTTVLELSRFLSILFNGGATPEGTRILSRATLDTMWTPQFAAPGATSRFGIGFALGKLDGHRTVGHGGAIYGFATTLLALPDDSIGVVVTATLDGVNTVTDRIGAQAMHLMLEQRAGRPIVDADTTAALAPGQALSLIGRYANARTAIDLEESEGQLFHTPVGGGQRGELRLAALRASANGTGRALELMVDDRLDYGTRVHVLADRRLVIGTDTLTRQATPGSDVVAMATPRPAKMAAEFASLVGEYGWDHNILYIRERDGQLRAQIEWFFDYPLTRESRDVYKFPKSGLYDGADVKFTRDANGRATVAIAGTVPFKRRTLPGDNDAINSRTPPVRPAAELRREALLASPPREPTPARATDLVELQTLDRTIKYDIRYATSNNFMGTPFYSSAHAFMQRPAAEGVARASAALRKLGYGLLIHDSYRPWYVTKMFWDGTPADKHVFVADPQQGSRHNRGCAVDLTLYDLKTGAPINMPGGYDETTDRSYPLYPGGNAMQRWHRDLLRHALEAQGFNVYEAEWWHFDYKDWRSYGIGNQTFEQLLSAKK